MAATSRPLLTEEPTYKALQDYFDKNGASINMPQMFATDPQRFEKYRLQFCLLCFKIYEFTHAVLGRSTCTAEGEGLSSLWPTLTRLYFFSNLTILVKVFDYNMA